ncbi:MAG: homocysteine biosynthesis protein [Candidatus Hadarchaeum sp.]|uniref:homocysteine biosynthesis protein n=1 Tax=Candidatus Hadarchaeum sp. TaxID=2883567 RepID=UPI0031796DFD
MNLEKTAVRKSVAEINEKIKRGDAVVVTAEEMVEIVREKGPVGAAKEVDVVTTGTFGAMCSSGAWLNFGHSDPPIKMQRVWINDVEAYTGVAAVDAYIGATQLSETRGMEYGGGHVIEDLVRGKEVEVRATAYGTDCYPRTQIETRITINDLNQAVLCNPRNAYQKYTAATNSRNETIYTYMGTLLPRYGNVTYSGAGELSPLNKDPNYETIGIGTRIFLGGAQGYIFWEGTQHNPTKALGTIMTVGNLKEMDARYIRGASIDKYGTSLFVGLGIPIPIINERVAKTAGAGDDEIKTNIVDYGVPRRDRPVLREVTYAELKSGKVRIGDRDVPVSPLSSLKRAREIANVLKKWIAEKRFFLTEPVERLPTDRIFKPMKQTGAVSFAKDLMVKTVVTAKPNDTIVSAAKIIAEKGFDHLPIVDDDGRLVGIVTSWDIAVAVATKKKKLSEIMTAKVITAKEDEPVELVARKLEKYGISGVPVVGSKGELKGIITSDDLSKLLRR